MKKIFGKLVAVVLVALLAVPFASTAKLILPVEDITACAADVTPDQMYLVEKSIYSDNFDDGVISTERITYTEGSVTETDGSLKLNNGYTNDVDINIQDNGSMLTDGIYAVSFKIKKDQYDKQVTFSFMNSNNFVLPCFWSGDSNIYITKNSSGYERGYCLDGKNLFHDVYMVFEHDSSVNNGTANVKVYFDNELIYDAAADKSGGIMKVRFGKVSNVNYCIDDFHVYKAVLNSALLDANAIEADSLINEAKAEDDGCIILTQDLTLPAAGSNGSTITWKSSDSTLVSDDGTVYRPANGYLLSDKVTMTATFSKGSNSLTKSFDYKVKRQDKELPINIDGDYILYDDFSTNTVSFNYTESDTAKGVITAENGMLTVSNADNVSGQYRVDIILNDDGAVCAAGSGEYVFEYDLKTDKRSNIQSWFLANSSLSSYICNTFALGAVSAGSSVVNIDTVRDDIFHVKYHLNLNDNKWTLWIDDAPVFVNASPAGRSTAYCFSLFVVEDGTAQLDNIKFYKLASSLNNETEYENVKVTKDGETKLSVDAPGTYRFSASYAYKGEGFNPPAIVYALYNKDTNSLEAVKAIPASELTEGVIYYYTDIIDVPEKYENYILKAFRLENMQSIVPLTEAIVLE